MNGEKLKKEEILENPSVAEMLFQEEAEDNKNYKIAVLIAVVLHIVLITAVFPSVGKTEVLVKDIKEPPTRYFPIPPPEQDLEEVVLHKKKDLVPVPDPDPDAVEPDVDVDMEFDNEIPEGEFIVMSGEIEPPEVPDVVRAGIVGLEPPVYSMSQLQRNAVYPELGIKTRLQGMVVLEVVLKKDGTVGEVKVIGGLRTLGFPQSAISAVRKLRFSPGKLRGIPVDVIMTLTIHYRLKR